MKHSISIYFDIATENYERVDLETSFIKEKKQNNQNEFFIYIQQMTKDRTADKRHKTMK